DGADSFHVHDGAPAGAIEVDDVDEWRPEPDEVLSDAFGPVRRRADASRDAGPEDDPRSAVLDVDRGDDLHRVSWPRSVGARPSPRRRRSRRPRTSLLPAAPGGGS